MVLVFTRKNIVLAVSLLALAACGGGSGSTVGNVVAVTVTVSGKVFYEFVPPRVQGNNPCAGLDFNNIETRPIRAATVQLLDAGSNVLATTIADNGDYAFANVAANLNVRLRVRAELKRTGAPSWDVEVRDNVDTSPNPPPLGSRPLYVVDSAIFNTGGADVTRDLTATTGWGGSSYTGPRAAAPFAILDAIYSGMQLVLTANANAVFGPMDAFWSVNNTTDFTGPTDRDAGNLGTSFYSGDIDSLFLLGDANDDTEEFDDHVIVHEWGHYFEDVFSRSDSIGGPHAGSQSLDARLAFGEGWATALAAMALDDPQYCDTGAAGTSSGFGIDTENYNFGAQGWFNEMSVATFLYDLWDTEVDADANGTDADSIGFGPIFETMAGPQMNTAAFTTLFSFAAELRPMLNTTQRLFVDSQLARENIETAGIDVWGSTQDNIVTPPNQARDVLPLYTTLPTDGTVINTCANSDYDSGRDGNKLAEYRYLRFITSSSNSWTIVANANPIPPPTSDMPGPMDPPVRDRSDPDLYLYRNGSWLNSSDFGQPGSGTSGDADTETLNTNTLSPDTYVIALQEFRFEDEDSASSDFPEQICFDVSASPL